METGTIVSLKLDKGFGFIARAGGGKDIFFHFRDMGDGLEFGESLQEMRVAFDVQQTDRGPQAVNIRAAR